MSVRVLLVAASAVATSACSLLTSFDGLTGGANTDAGDGGISTDAPFGSDASGGAGDSGASNLLTNPGFEVGSLGCGGTWSGGYNATYMLSPEAHSGSRSCMVCPTAAGLPSFSLALTNPLTLGPGSYFAEAWIRAPVSGTVAGHTGVLVDERPPDGGTVYDQGTFVMPDTVWASSTESFALAATTQLSVSVHVFFPNDGCVLVDDVSLVQR